MNFRLSKLKNDWALMPYFFSDEQVKEIRKRIRHLKLEHVVYCSFENRYAKSGGLGAVTQTILPWLNEAKWIGSTMLITPYHSHILPHNLVPKLMDVRVFGERILDKVPGKEKKEILACYRRANCTPKTEGYGCYSLRPDLTEEEFERLCDILIQCGYRLEKTGIKFPVYYRGKDIEVELFRHREPYTVPGKGEIFEYYLKADGFFNAQNKINDPYIFSEDKEQNDRLLLDNALFYSRAIPLAMRALGKLKNILFHLQEWQTAMVALSAKAAMLSDVLESCASVQTIHNPFDSGITIETLKECFSWPGSPVSRQIKDLDSNREFAAHFFNKHLTVFQLGLQLTDGQTTTVSESFARELTGDILQTEHFGPHLQQIFKRGGVYGINNGQFHSLPAEFSKGTDIDVEEIAEIKEQKRRELLEALADYHPEGTFGSLSYLEKSIAELPDDIPVIAMSGRLDPNQKGYDIFLEALERMEKDRVKVILTPMAVKDSHLDIFREAAEICEGDLLVFPVRMKPDYFKLMQMGATYTVIPSIYEPFGGAIEYIVNGTPPIARQTGGLKNQVINDINGFLFREPLKSCDVEAIEQFIAASESTKDRKKNPWVIGMVDALHKTLLHAIDIYQNHREEYYELILEGFMQARIFDWKTSARKYCRVFRKVGGPHVIELNRK